MPTYKIDISYNGTNFHGFQQQPKNRTIQGEILEVLDRLIDNYELNYSGRTDSGVHAKSQIISVRSQHELNSKFVHSFNSLITNEIRMNKLSKVKDEFNPRFDAKSRVYRYFILNNSKELPFSKDYVYYIEKYFELEQLNNISKIFLGEKNFQNFSKLRTNQTPLRKILLSKWSVQNSKFIYTIEGNSFLHNMVRSIVGCQLAVIDGKISINDLKKSLLNPNDTRHRFMVPSSGLHLWLSLIHI